MARRSRFTPTDDSAIRHGYAIGRSVASIATAIGRNRYQIIGRAFRLGLKHRSWYGDRGHEADLSIELRRAARKQRNAIRCHRNYLLRKERRAANAEMAGLAP